MDTSSIYTLIHWIEREWGVFFPEGGTGALVNGRVKLFEDIGGDLRLNSPVETAQIVSASNEFSPHETQHLIKASGTESLV